MNTLPHKFEQGITQEFCHCCGLHINQAIHDPANIRRWETQPQFEQQARSFRLALWFHANTHPTKQIVIANSELLKTELLNPTLEVIIDHQKDATLFRAVATAKGREEEA